MQVPVIETPNFTISLEYESGQTFMHCEVFAVYNKTVKRELQHALNLLLSIRQTPLLVIPNIGDTKLVKFLTLLGFEFLMTTECLDKKQRDIYIIN
jgi:hypothetical protein